jgi:hypothetical protein
MDRVDPQRRVFTPRRVVARRRLTLAWGLAACLALVTGGTPRPAAARPENIRSVPDYAVTFELRDGRSGQPVAARMRVIGSDGRDYYPLPRAAGFYHESYFGQHYFYGDGDLTLRVPPGRTILWACRGFEYVTRADTSTWPWTRPAVDFSRFDDSRRRLALGRHAHYHAWRRGSVRHGTDAVF